MKKKIFLSLAMVFAIALTIVSCQKSKYCLCVSNDSYHTDTIREFNNETQQIETIINEYLYKDSIVVNVDPSMSCKGIAQLGIQRQTMDENGSVLSVDSIYNFDCTKIKRDSLIYYPGIHQ